MSRPKRGLGQGLSALVPPSEPSPPDASDSTATGDTASQTPQAPAVADPPTHVRWEYAALERRPKKANKKRRFTRIWFSATGTDALFEPRATVLAARSSWSALGLLGAEGWELVGLDDRWFFFKRPVLPEGERNYS